MERTGIVTVEGKPLTLVGPDLAVGEKAPAFVVVGKDLGEVSSTEFKGRTMLISVTPSLDTPVCDLQARRFNEEAASLPPDVAVLNISMDLPFAIARFCTAAGIDRIQTLSDHREASFGNAYGVLVKELRLLARSTFVIDRGGIIRHIEIVPELKDHPDYEAALAAVRKLMK